VPAQKEAQERETGRIVAFPTRISPEKGNAWRKKAGKIDVDEAQIEDLRKYERGTEPDDYHRRMIINVIAFAFIVALTLAGIWLADQLALLRKNQDCVLSGRKNCGGDINIQIRNR
jgi:hypothetical protein